MAAPDTRFIWDDQSTINPNTAVGADYVDRPVLMTVFSSDKGPEEFKKELTGEDFFALYGDNPNFFKHGQALLEAAAIANAGGLQYCKRVVAPDSKLANLALMASVKEVEVQKTNPKGKPLYYKDEVNETYWVEKKESDIPDEFLKTIQDFNKDVWEDYTPEVKATTDVNKEAWNEYTPKVVETDKIDTDSWKECTADKVDGEEIDTASWKEYKLSGGETGNEIPEYKKEKVSTYTVNAKVYVMKEAKKVFYQAIVAKKPLYKQVDEVIEDYNPEKVDTYVKDKSKVKAKDGKFYIAKQSKKPLYKTKSEDIEEYKEANVASYKKDSKVKVSSTSGFVYYIALVDKTSLYVQETEAIDEYKPEEAEIYPVNGKVKYGEKFYKKVKDEKKPLFTEHQEPDVKEYAPDQEYKAGFYVLYGGKYYVAAKDITGKETDADTTPGAVSKVESIDAKTDDKANDPIMIKAAKIKYFLKSLPSEDQINDTDHISEVFNNVTSALLNKKDELIDNQDPESTNYVLFSLTDTGRGISNKKIRVYADTSTRRPVPYIKYVLKVMEGNKTLETHYFTFDPLIVESIDGTAANAKNKSIKQVINQNSNNLKCEFYEYEWNKMAKDVAAKSGVHVEEVAHMDILFGYDRYGKLSNSVVIDSESDNISVENGVLLKNGDYGAFGKYPIQLPEILDKVGDSTGLTLYDNQVLKVFTGEYSDDIYDLDNTRIDAIFDANYKKEIKDAIDALVTFREDCFFFRDFGLGLSTLNEIDTVNDLYKHNKFVANYINSYDVIEPYYRKQVNVTVMYNLVTRFVAHYLNGVNRPFCGQAYGVTFENDIVPGTINFSPKRTPQTDYNAQTYNQKQWFDDNRLNYIAYYSGIPTMDTEYTSQEQYTQLSWINNVLLVQSIIHEIRRQCPKNRYIFMDGQDLIRYKSDVEAVLNKYRSQFKEITIEYAEDELYEQNKIFYAVIKVKFRDFIQSEIFKITMIN